MAQRGRGGLLHQTSYWIAKPLLHALARLPLAALYRLADLAFFVVYRALRVRRAVARDNLSRCFPNATREEIARIEERCYRNACDAAAEWLWLLAAGPEQIRDRVRTSLAIAYQLRDERRSAIYVLGHCGNWEWAIPAGALALPGLRLHVVYHPLRNAALNRIANAVRGRYGVALSTMERAPRAILGMRSQLTATILVADQRPPSDNAYVVPFLGRETGFLRGPERLARSLDLPVVFVEMKRTARGRYEMSAEWLCEDPGSTSEGEITELFARRLEQQILKTPEDWFWMHRRWRNRRAERAV